MKPRSLLPVTHPRRLLSALLFAAALPLFAASPPLYQNAFENAEVGQVPGDMLVLDGGWAVRSQGTNQVLELPGAPLESYGLLFGPADKENIAVAARVLSTHKGRRYPTFAVGMNGVGGYRLQVSPAKKEIEILKNEVVRAAVPYSWPSGQWVHLRLELRVVGEGAWKIDGRVWAEGSAPPVEPTLSVEDKEAPKPGRPGIYASPFAGTVIAYDDLTFTRLNP